MQCSAARVSLKSRTGQDTISLPLAPQPALESIVEHPQSTDSLLLTHGLNNVARWEPLGTILSLYPGCLALLLLHGWLMDDGDTRVASMAIRFAKTTALLVIKWSGWAICWLPVIVGGMAAMLVDTLLASLNAPWTTCAM